MFNRYGCLNSEVACVNEGCESIDHGRNPKFNDSRQLISQCQIRGRLVEDLSHPRPAWGYCVILAGLLATRVSGHWKDSGHGSQANRPNKVQCGGDERRVDDFPNLQVI